MLCILLLQIFTKGTLNHNSQASVITVLNSCLAQGVFPFLRFQKSLKLPCFPGGCLLAAALLPPTGSLARLSNAQGMAASKGSISLFER